MAGVLTRRFLSLFHGQCRSASEEVWLAPPGRWGGGQRLKVGRRRDGTWLEAHPIPLACALVSARSETQPGRDPAPGAPRGIDAGLQLPKQLPPGTSFFLVLGAAWCWRQHGAVRRGPVSDRSLLSEGTGQVGRPCLDQLSSPVCSSPNLARQDLQPLAVPKPVAGLRARRGAGTEHREAALRPRRDEARDRAKKAQKAKAPPHTFCCCSWFCMERG